MDESNTYARKTDLAVTALGALASLGNILSSVTATCEEREIKARS